MGLINWDSSLSVKVAEIDRQHQKLVMLINELNEAMKQRKTKEILGNIVDGLLSYTAIHFKTEEKYFAQYSYPDASTHNQEHTAFVKRVADFKEKFDKGQLALSIEVMKFLSDWLQNHIKGTDRKYSDFFNEKGLT